MFSVSIQACQSVIDKELSDIKDSTVQSIVGRHSDAI